MRENIIVANWKMHGERALVQEYFRQLQSLLQGCEVDAVICPPVLYAADAQVALVGSNERLYIGAQNVSCHAEFGAYTGELNAAMLNEFGCSYVIVGHSERRRDFNECSSEIARKFLAVKESGMTPIFCVGETLAQHQSGNVEAVIRQQIEEVIAVVGSENFEGTIVAYEPIWAIGTGESALPNQIEEIHDMIRQIFISDGVDADENLRIIYGGSVKPENAKNIFSKPNVDGALVGKASLNADGFSKIVYAAQ